MILGALKDVPFEVSEKRLLTPQSFVWSGSAQIATQKRLGGDALTEWAGNDADTMDLQIRISAYLGVNVMQTLRLLWEYLRKATPLPLTIGDHAYGKYRWLIQSLRIEAQHTDREGNVTDCGVSVKLIEYLRK